MHLPDYYGRVSHCDSHQLYQHVNSHSNKDHDDLLLALLKQMFLNLTINGLSVFIPNY